MLIDADVTFLQNPKKFFQSNLFIKHRALFFQDRTIPMTDKSYFYQKLQPILKQISLIYFLLSMRRRIMITNLIAVG